MKTQKLFQMFRSLSESSSLQQEYLFKKNLTELKQSTLILLPFSPIGITWGRGGHKFGDYSYLFNPQRVKFPNTKHQIANNL